MREKEKSGCYSFFLDVVSVTFLESCIFNKTVEKITHGV